jgi:hypothetical protein
MRLYEDLDKNIYLSSGFIKRGKCLECLTEQFLKKDSEP